MRKLPLLPLLVVGAVLSAPLAVRAQDQVTISKSRLEELEKKEAELESLKGLSTRSPQGATKPGGAPAQAGAVAAPAQAPQPMPYVAPPIDTLTPVGEDETVQALDLAGHYAQDKATADKRYLKRSFGLEGTVERFEKRAFGRYYSILLNTGGSKVKVSCDIFPGQKYSTVYPASRGTEIVGVSGESRVVLAKAGNKVLVHGECKGLDVDEVGLKGCELKKVWSGAN